MEWVKIWCKEINYIDIKQNFGYLFIIIIWESLMDEWLIFIVSQIIKYSNHIDYLRMYLELSTQFYILFGKSYFPILG